MIERYIEQMSTYAADIDNLMIVTTPGATVKVSFDPNVSTPHV